MNRVYIKTYGCQMNERDSEAVAAQLRDRGYSIVGNEWDRRKIERSPWKVKFTSMEVFMTIRRTSVILMVFIGCLSAVSAVAQDRGSLYLGGSFSLTDATIIDQFTRYREGVLIEKNTFEDEYNGQGYGFSKTITIIDDLSSCKRVISSIDFESSDESFRSKPGVSQIIKEFDL